MRTETLKITNTLSVQVPTGSITHRIGSGFNHIPDLVPEKKKRLYASNLLFN